jgi:signal recognition particle receptor subunit beta
MAVFDAEQRRLVIRVVYDGPALAGKTTNVSQVCGFFPAQRRSELYTPGALRGRTMFFDWLEIDAGRVGGQAFRCQLLTVPGQSARSYRRRPLLRSADAVVVVCDSTPAALPDAQRTLAELRTVLRTRRPAIVPIVLQANKQDARDALAPDALARALRLDATVPVVPACASTGAGVREALVAAMRAAMREVQRHVATYGLDTLAAVPETPDQLFGWMLELEDTPECDPNELETAAADVDDLDVADELAQA